MANKPEDICVSLDTAKRLQESGIVIDALYYWMQYDAYDFEIRTDFHLVTNEALENKREDDTVNVIRYYPAPTAEEFERFITSDYNDNVTKIDTITNGGNVSVGIHNFEKKTFYQGRWHAKKTEALAEIALYLTQKVRES